MWNIFVDNCVILLLIIPSSLLWSSGVGCDFEDTCVWSVSKVTNATGHRVDGFIRMSHGGPTGTEAPVTDFRPGTPDGEPNMFFFAHSVRNILQNKWRPEPKDIKLPDLWNVILHLGFYLKLGSFADIKPWGIPELYSKVTQPSEVTLSKSYPNFGSFLSSGSDVYWFLFNY